MAFPAAGRRLIRFVLPALLPALLAAATAHAADDSVHRAQQPPDLLDIETTAALSPNPDDHVPLEDRVDVETVTSAVAAYRRGALGEGDVIASTIDEPAVRALLEWVAIRSGAGPMPFARLDAFLRNHPNYPATALVRRRAEAALIAEKKGAHTVRAFFHGQEPLSPIGRVALALALKASGEAEAAAALIRRSWQQDQLSEGLERMVLAAFGEVLNQADHRLRTERYLFGENATAALRNAARVSSDYVILARARLASAKARAPIAAKLIEAVPASLKSDISFAFLQAQQARRADKPAEAAEALAKVPRDPALLGDGDGWWTERRLIARELLDEGNAAKAYEIAAGHGAEGAAERIDAEWHAGFIALRFRNDPAAAPSAPWPAAIS
jgi:soluble lytic murein transglycosylase